jgi:hypothetical protein
MLGLNPHIGAAGAHHPFQSMLQSGLHAAHAAAAAVAAQAHAANNNSTNLPPHPPPPNTKPSSLPSPAIMPPNVFGAGGGNNGPSSHPIHNVPINMWPFIYNHIQK